MIVAPDGWHWRWDWDRFQGEASWRALDCKTKAQLDGKAGSARDTGTPDGAGPGGDSEKRAPAYTIAGHTARFKIPLPERRGGRLTVVYSDSDDGRRQESLIGTSELRFGDPATMGESFPTNVACIVKRGALQPKPILLDASLTEAITEHLFDAAEGE